MNEKSVLAGKKKGKKEKVNDVFLVSPLPEVPQAGTGGNWVAFGLSSLRSPQS